ncbi:MAG TPA: response regulator [Nitrospirales bacterium]|jgi:two-component system cell cycle response regulator|nr:response regulator [Nitrospirales bacterium]
MAIILVVDDDRLICDLLQGALGKEGYEVVTASNGYEALELFIERRPSLTMVDICMPGLDGIEVIKQIRLRDSDAVVMVLTGLESDTLKNQARVWDVTEFLSKSAPLSQLIGTVDRALQQSEKAAAVCLRPGTADRRAGRQEAASILVVEDDLVLRELLADFLATRGYQVLTAQNGQEALSVFDKQPPQLVILDIHLPGGMNGVKVLRELRARGYTGAVIALSGVYEDSLLKEMLSLGAVKLIAKPFDLDRLALAIQVGLVITGCGAPSR